jgi:CDP-diacylglycerol---glycerol-3-phosphate 3-phosphatidyltransferase
MNLPNQLTVARLVLTVLFVAAALSGLPWAYSVAAPLFGIAAWTDYLDGKIARERSLVTSFGQLMDPLADKVLMASAFIVLLDADRATMPAWLVITVLAREFLVTGLRLVASAQGAILAAERLGKHKTVWQIACASYLLMMHASHEAPWGWMRWLFELPYAGSTLMVPLLLAVTLVITLWSGVSYVWKNRALVLKEL